ARRARSRVDRERAERDCGLRRTRARADAARAERAVSPSQLHILPPDPATYRTVLGHFATGVCIVTAMDGEEPVGMACNSFTSVSLDPALVLFCAAKSSSTWPRLRTSGKWAANILGEDGEEVCRLFAEKGADRFSGTAYTRGRSGSPILRDTLAFVDCE